MPGTPDDRAARVAARKLKAYSAYKGRQSQNGQAEDASLDADLTTVENWLLDSEDSGQAWARQKLGAVERDEQLAAHWQQTVRRDQQQAEEEEEQRRRVTPEQIKEELSKQIDQHASAVAALAESKEPGFRGKLSQVRSESLQAKKFLEENLEQSLQDTAHRKAAGRRQRQQIAAAMQERADVGARWRTDYQQTPSRYPEGQRSDVAAALQRIHDNARRKAETLTLLGSDAGPHCEQLNQVAGWAEEAAGAVNAARAREQIQPGFDHARATFANIDAFEAQQEREANEHMATFREWTTTNTDRARRWINSDSAKHRAWAEAWLGKKGSA